jgi:hypothetical protein
MHRPDLALLALLAATAATSTTGCSRKTEVVEAAPLAAPAPAAAPAADAAPAGRLPPGQMAPGAELPAGHPPLDSTGGAPAPDGAATPPPPPAHGAAMSAGADMGDVKVPKATGPDARTVAELYAQRAALKDKPVTLRGKVVKYNAGIMGKNWIHLRDGTGAAGKDNDVTVTSQDAAAVGEVITVKGTLAVDQDIGMGAPYPVIVQDAKVTK